MELLKDIVKEIKPSREEEKEVRKKVQGFIKRIKIKGAKPVLGGSGEKGTWLRGQFDADIFVLFNLGKFRDKDISGVLEKSLKKGFKKISRVHGSRDYFQVYEGEFLFEVIPILGIKKTQEAENITDISPLHAAWVKKKVNEKLRDEVRLMKHFCRAHEIYGAESYIQGFSGYVCEILIVYYGSFLNILKQSAKWKEKTVIDINKYWKNKNVLMELNKSKLQSPLIVIDPVQKDRNAAAALSSEKFEKFKGVAKRFLKKPSKEFFIKKEIKMEELIKKAQNKKLVVLEIEPITGKEDVVGSKLLKSLNYIKDRLEENEFRVLEHGWKWDKKKGAVFWFIFDKKDLEEFKKQVGPPMQAVQFGMEFKEKHKKVFIEKNRMCAMVKREYVKAEDLIKYLVKNDGNVKDKIKKLEALIVK